MRDLPIVLYPSAPLLIQIRGKPATNPLTGIYRDNKDSHDLKKFLLKSFPDHKVLKTPKGVSGVNAAAAIFDEKWRDRAGSRAPRRPHTGDSAVAIASRCDR